MILELSQLKRNWERVCMYIRAICMGAELNKWTNYGSIRGWNLVKFEENSLPPFGEILSFWNLFIWNCPPQLPNNRKFAFHLHVRLCTPECISKVYKVSIQGSWVVHHFSAVWPSQTCFKIKKFNYVSVCDLLCCVLRVLDVLHEY